MTRRPQASGSVSPSARKNNESSLVVALRVWYPGVAVRSGETLNVSLFVQPILEVGELRERSRSVAYKHEFAHGRARLTQAHIEFCLHVLCCSTCSRGHIVSTHSKSFGHLTAFAVDARG